MTDEIEIPETPAKRRSRRAKASDKPKQPALRGFAAISPERQRAIAAMGSRAVPKEKRSFSLNRELAIASGRRGGRWSSKKAATDA